MPWTMGGQTALCRHPRELHLLVQGFEGQQRRLRLARAALGGAGRLQRPAMCRLQDASPHCHHAGLTDRAGTTLRRSTPQFSFTGRLLTWNSRSVPRKPGMSQSKRPHSSPMLFWIGVPLRMTLWDADTPRHACAIQEPKDQYDRKL